MSACRLVRVEVVPHHDDRSTCPNRKPSRNDRLGIARAQPDCRPGSSRSVLVEKRHPRVGKAGFSGTKGIHEQPVGVHIVKKNKKRVEQEEKGVKEGLRKNETRRKKMMNLGYRESNPGLMSKLSLLGSESHRCYRYTIPD